MTDTLASPEFTTIVRCTGQCRWVPLSSFQAHRRKLQQAWEVQQYRYGMPWKQYVEWRDVPLEENP